MGLLSTIESVADPLIPTFDHFLSAANFFDLLDLLSTKVSQKQLYRMTINKISRSDNFHSHREKRQRQRTQVRKERAKLEEQDPTLRVKRVQENVPHTIERKRRYDPARLNDALTQVLHTQPKEVKSEDESDSAAEEEEQDDDDEEEKCTSTGMRTLITTSPKSTAISFDFLQNLKSIFPLSETIPRKTAKYTIQDIARYASNRGYQNLIITNEDVKKVNAISFIQLPNGPTAYFTITSLQLKSLASHTTHHPELILQNFTTQLGQEIAGIFQSLMPKQPEFQGRQTVTLHNSRDFIFFRRHRYLFAGKGDRVRLQEIGPRFTLKCREVVDGVGRQGVTRWVSSAKAESDRKRMFL